ncbi:hypothetical protein [Methylobacterium goesingense]|uniref:Uncharacterized protein n=1 Tax=Methylobacterium goesingense TaxID=243690 RepID=A0ABV2L6Z0_9HYPH|nr:hypothetical protein CFIICLFH_1746 [Methylobacterium goesingense]
MTPTTLGRGAGLLVAAALALIPGRTLAQAALSTGPDCGGDAYSSAQVIENRPARRGPLTAVPDTLCADVAPQGQRAPVEIGIYPSLGATGMPARDGARGPNDPYEERPPRSRRP